MEINVRSVPYLAQIEQQVHRPELDAEDYLQRVNLLSELMNTKNLDYVVIYGDREHFASIEYFSSYDCRFEEGLWILDKSGNKHIIVGNEGYGYSYQIPYPIQRHLYHNFSLQGQPKHDQRALHTIFSSIGINANSKVGIVGYKYFVDNLFENPESLFDIPEYILSELRKINSSFTNITKDITGLPNGIRMRIHNVKEIAWIEYVATKSAAVMKRLLDQMQPGISELELSSKAAIDFMPVTMYSLVNFGANHVAIGLRSPDDTTLKEGAAFGLCYSLRGSLCSRTGLALKGPSAETDDVINNFYKPYWSAIATWYENVKLNARAGDVYEKVMSFIGEERFGVMLNPGHNIGMDEWTNSPFYPNSDLLLPNGTHLQCDMICVNQDPYCSGICEDTVVIADETMRAELQQKYPEVYDRIIKRQEMMRTELGIQIDDSLLPMSNLNAVYFPYGLNRDLVFHK